MGIIIIQNCAGLGETDATTSLSERSLRYCILAAMDDNLPHGMPLHAPGPRVPDFPERIRGVNHGPQFLPVEQVEEHIHVRAVGDVQEREILLLGEPQGMRGARHEPLRRRVEVDDEPGRGQLGLVERKGLMWSAIDHHVVFPPRRALWRGVGGPSRWVFEAPSGIHHFVGPQALEQSEIVGAANGRHVSAAQLGNLYEMERPDNRHFSVEAKEKHTMQLKLMVDLCQHDRSHASEVVWKWQTSFRF